MLGKTWMPSVRSTPVAGRTRCTRPASVPGVLPIAASKHGPRKVLTGHGSLRRPLPLYEPLGRRMPVRREYGLHISGLILDGLVPTDAAMRGAEGGHGLDELIDLSIQEGTTILRPKNLGLVGRPILPGLHREAIARPMELHQ